MKREDEIEAFIRESFEENFERLRLESGHTISPDLKQNALDQILFYWQKMREVAESITETEVRLHLANQKTKRGRRFSIEGIVDIVKDRDEVVMYDIKTHDADYVRDNISDYEKQIDLYAYIWTELRKQQLDRAGIIATSYPENVKEAIASKDVYRLARALQEWNPLIEIDFDLKHVDSMIQDFRRVVDAIEDHEFAPPPLEKLKSPYGRKKNPFAVEVCRNCDARFSCPSYRAYAQKMTGRAGKAFQAYYDDLGSDDSRAEWKDNTLAVAPEVETLVVTA